MRAHPHRPLPNPLLSQVPVITQPIGQDFPGRTHPCRTDGTVIAERLDLILGLVVPEVDAAIGAGSHEPAFIDRVEADTVDGV